MLLKVVKHHIQSKMQWGQI